MVIFLNVFFYCFIFVDKPLCRGLSIDSSKGAAQLCTKQNNGNSKVPKTTCASPQLHVSQLGMHLRSDQYLNIIIKMPDFCICKYLISLQITLAFFIIKDTIIF